MVRRISVIVPTRDRPADLARCLAGLAECETALMHELVVVDDASADPDATEPARRCTLPARLIRNDSRLGAGASRQRAAAVASGDVLAFLDDDAIPRGDWLSRIAQWVDDGAVAITGRVLPYDSGVLSAARQARYDARYADLRPGALVPWFAGGNSAVLAGTFRAVGGFSQLGTGGDNSLAAVLAARGTPVWFAPDLVVVHRNGKGWRRALVDAFAAGVRHPLPSGRGDITRALSASAIGPTWTVREVNRVLGLAHAVGRLAAGRRSR